MDTKSTAGTSWTDRLGRWWKAIRPGARTPVPLALPRCAECGAETVRLELSQGSDDWHMRYVGTSGAGNGAGDAISAQRAQAILAALEPPYQAEEIRAAGFYDDLGFCVPCGKFYCPTHWQVSSTGAGTCPAGHFKSLDPHWHP